MNNKILKVGTFFSGIGSFEHALLLSKIPHKLIFACDIDKYCKQNFINNYKENDFCSDKIVEYLEHLELKKYKSYTINLKYSIFLFALSLIIKLKKIIKKIYNFKPKTNQELLLEKLHDRKIGNLMNPNNFKTKTKLIAKTISINKFKVREIIPNVFCITEK